MANELPKNFEEFADARRAGFLENERGKGSGETGMRDVLSVYPGRDHSRRRAETGSPLRTQPFADQNC